MRFYEIAMFIVLLNVSIMMVNALNIFPSVPNTITQDQGMINTLNSTARNYDPNVPPSGVETGGFGALVWGTFNALNLVTGLLGQVAFGVSGTLYGLIGCSASSCGSGIVTVVNLINLMIVAIYALAIGQLLAGRYMEG
jgi:hypothetical protein